MRIVRNYIFREITGSFLLSLFIFTFVLLLERIMQLVELVVSRGVSVADIIMLFLYILPSFLTLTVPMSFLLAVLLAFGRLSSDSEVIAMKASGVSFYQMFIPVSLLSVMTYVLTLYLMIYALPWGNQSFRVKVFDIASGKATTGLKERVFNDDFDGIVLYVDRLKDSGSGMEGVFIFDQREKEGYTILAQEGGIASDPKAMTVTMRLKNGEIHQAGEGSYYNRIAFATYDLRLNFKGSGSDKKGQISKGDREMTIAELSSKIAELKGKGGDPTPYQIELHKKFSIPFACIVFGLIGAPLGIQSKRSGRAWGFSISLAIFLIYYVSLTGGESLGDKGVIPPFIGMWGPNIVFLGIGLYLTVKTAMESPIAVSVWLDRFMDFISDSIRKTRGK